MWVRLHERNESEIAEHIIECFYSILTVWLPLNIVIIFPINNHAVLGNFINIQSEQYFILLP